MKMATKPTKNTTRKNGKRKGGRQPVQLVKHPDSEAEIEGLRCHKTTNTYYRIGDDGKARVYYKRQGRKGIDYLRRAIYEHICWLNGNTPTDTISVPSTNPAYDVYGAEIMSQPDDVYISKDDLGKYIRDQLSNPATRTDFANSVGIPELINLHSLPPIAAPLPLQKILDNYIDGKIFKHNRQYGDAKRCWGLFVDAVKTTNLDDIDATHLQRFNRAISKAGESRTQKNILVTIQSILNYAANSFKHHRQMILDAKVEIKNICSFDTQKQPNPKPMKKAAYHALLKQCKDDPMWTAILLTSLNLALHPGEMADLETAEFDLDELVFTSNRTKTGVSRVGTVWKRTAKAIKAYKKTEHFKSNPTPLLFTNRNHKKIIIQRINEKMSRLRNNAELGSDVVFDGMRDLFRTSAGAANYVAIKWTMGHSLGEDDKYGFRDPKETAEVMAKVEKAVFGN